MRPVGCLGVPGTGTPLRVTLRSAPGGRRVVAVRSGVGSVWPLPRSTLPHRQELRLLARLENLSHFSAFRFPELLLFLPGLGEPVEGSLVGGLVLAVRAEQRLQCVSMLLGVGPQLAALAGVLLVDGFDALDAGVVDACLAQSLGDVLTAPFGLATACLGRGGSGSGFGRGRLGPRGEGESGRSDQGCNEGESSHEGFLLVRGGPAGRAPC